jgi:phenylacetate-CoA ligase
LQFQVVQRTTTTLKIFVVRAQPFTADEVNAVRAYMHETLGYPFDIDISYVEQIPRSPSGKYEDFRSEV